MGRTGTALGCIMLCVLGVVPSRLGAAEHPPSETLCILDFTRHGGEDRLDWLSRGMADLMTVTLNRVGRYRIVEREHLRGILDEHGLSASGLADPEKALRAGTLAKAQFLLTGSFALVGEVLTVQARLLRLADQKLVSQATWRDEAAKALSAPAVLSRDLLGGLGTTFEEKFLSGVEGEFPETLDAARSFYLGMEAFDAGDYPLALTHYLQGSRDAGSFVRVRREAVRMYYLLGESGHGVLFAQSTARSLQKHDPARALEFLFLASQKAVNPLGRPSLAATLLGEIDRLARRHEKISGEAGRMKEFVRQRIFTLAGTEADPSGPRLLQEKDLRWRLWVDEIPSQIERRARTGGYTWALHNGSWMREPVPEPSVFMWRIRSLLELARLSAGEDSIQDGLRYYREILMEYDFLNDLDLFDEGTRFYWNSGIRLEAHFMILRHYGKTGRLIRDPLLMPHLKVLGQNEQFLRDYSDPHPDRHARVWSRRGDGGHEFFDFAAPEGRQVARVAFEALTRGPAWLSLYLPDPKGWPPQFDFSRRQEKLRLSPGLTRRSFDLPEGTAFFSLSVLWGPRWGGGFISRPPRGRDHEGSDPGIDWWKIAVELAPGKDNALPPSFPEGIEADERLVTHYAGRWGWDEGRVLRSDTPHYTNSPKADVFTREWSALAVNGDLTVLHQESLLFAALPLTVNTDQEEFDPWLVRTHEGGYALLWSRGQRGNPSGRFFSKTRDFVRWGTPRRMVFEEPESGKGVARRCAEGSVNIAPVEGGYLMLLCDGKVRFSSGLTSWKAPEKIFEYDGLRQTVLTTRDGRVWVIGTRAADREIDARNRGDMSFGYYRTGDGRMWQKREAVVVYHSLDGRRWSRGKIIHEGKEPSGLWALPVSPGRIAVVVGYHNLDLLWLVASGPESFRKVPAGVRFPLNSSEADFFLRRGKLWSARAAHDYINEEFVMLLSASRTLHEFIARGGREH